mgnify:CR=1 FL=1
MVDWQVTVTTIHCEAVDDYVTLMVYKDKSANCVGYKKYGEGITKEVAKGLKKKAKELGKEFRCEGPECHRLIEYRDKLFAEEEAKAKS